MDRHGVFVVAVVAVLVIALVPTPARSTNHEMVPRDDDNEAFHDDIHSQDATDENGIAQDSQPGDAVRGVLDVMWIFRVINEDREPVSGARVVVDHFATDASGGTLYVSVHACGDVHHFQVDVDVELDRDEVLEQVEDALLTDELPGVPIGTVLSTDFYENVAIGLLQIPCGGEEDAGVTDEQEVDSDDVNVSVDSELVDFTWPQTNTRDYEIEATNKRSEPMTDFKVCVPDKDDSSGPSTTEEDAEDVVTPEEVPDGWSYEYTDRDGDGDNDCLVFEADEGEGIDEGEKLSVKVRSEYSGEESIGVVQYVPSYGPPDDHEEGDDTTGLGPVPFAVATGSDDGLGGALKRGSVRAGSVGSAFAPPDTRSLLSVWRSDAEEKYNPAVEEGQIPRFVSRAVERRNLVKLADVEEHVAVRTDPDGVVASIELLPPDEADDFYQQVTVETDTGTIESVRKSDNPAETVRFAMRNGDVRLYGEGIDESLKTRLGTVGAKVTGGAGPEEIYEGVEESALGYSHVEPENETEDSSGMEMRNVVDRNGGVRGVTTRGVQELIEDGGTDGLSKNAGVYGDRDVWERRRERSGGG